jgi:hypothetical protein
MKRGSLVIKGLRPFKNSEKFRKIQENWGIMGEGSRSL